MAVDWEDVKEARRRLSIEQGAVIKDWGGRLAIALVYPNSYYVGMSNLGFQTIYGILNSHDRMVGERAFWEGKAPLSLESQRPLGDFAILAFSISYELDYLNAVQLLKAEGIPLLAEQRHEGHPLLIGGGPCITSNPEPLADIFDCLAIGEAEVILPGFIETAQEYIAGGRTELLQALSKLPGIYVPALSQTVSRQWAKDIDSFATTSVVLTPETELGDMYLMEIARGCRRGCRFCLAGYAFRPFRARSVEKLAAQAEAGLSHGKRLGLIGADIADYPQLDTLLQELGNRQARLSVSSLRVKPLSERLLRALADSNTRTVTLAPEAGSERLRRTIGKPFSEDDILRAVDRVARRAFPQLKLYFMVGLPGETDDDVQDLIKLALTCRELIERRKSPTRIILNVAPFVPKAGTPFQRCGMTEPQALERRLRMVRSSLRQRDVEVKPESVDWSVAQAVLSRGDRRLAQALTRLSGTSLASWRRAMKESHLDAHDYAHREFSPEDKLPWDNIDSGVDAGYLRKELDKARRGAGSAPCPKTECHRCGVC